MINAWHLLWIIPLSASFGLGFMAVLQAGARYENKFHDCPGNHRGSI